MTATAAESSPSTLAATGATGSDDVGSTGFLRLIDQTRLPTEFVEIDCRDVPAVWEAIKALTGSGRAGDRHRGGLRGGDRARGLEALTTERASLARSARPPLICAPAGRPPSTCSGHSTGWTLLMASIEPARWTERFLTDCWTRPARSTRKTGPCAGRSAGTGQLWSSRGRGS